MAIISGSDRGNDVLVGTDGNDDMYGYRGDDTLIGGEGDDDLQGGPGTNVLDGGEGNDRLAFSVDGHHVLIGGDGHDTAYHAWGQLYHNNYVSKRMVVDLRAGTYQIFEDGSPGPTSGTLHLIGVEEFQLYEQDNSDLSGDDTFHDNDESRIVRAGNGDDVVYGHGGNDTLDGGEGDDELWGGSGDDTLDGGDDSDELFGGSGADALDGGDGIDWADYEGSLGVNVDLERATQSGGDAAGDTLTAIENVAGSSFADTLRGDDSVNELWGLNGNDVLEGRGGGDILNGGGNVDTASYASSVVGVRVELDNLGGAAVASGGDADGDTLISIENLVGSALRDTLTGNSGANDIFGGAEADVLSGQGGDDDLYGEAGNDTLLGGSGRDVLRGGADGDTLDGGSGEDTMLGEGGNDTLIGGIGSDTLDGGSGEDTADYSGATNMVSLRLGLNGADGSAFINELFGTWPFVSLIPATDTLRGIENARGSNFADTLIGNTANNRFEGGAQNDTLDGGVGDDTLLGETGNDTLIGGFGNDTLDGGDDIDTVSFEGSSVNVAVTLGLNGADGSARQTTVTSAGSFLFLVNHVDIVRGVENVVGTGLNDFLTGNEQINHLTGGDGADTLTGGRGVDVVRGGAGADTFVLVSIQDAPALGAALAEYYADFSEAEGDRIDLSAIDANVNVAGNQAFTPIGIGAFSNVAGQLRFDTVTNLLEGDVDGNGAADFQIHLDTRPMNAATFIL